MSCFSTLKRRLETEAVLHNRISDSVIEVYDRRENTGSLRIIIGFPDDDDRHPYVKCYELGIFPEEKVTAALEMCNRANNRYSFVKFHIDGDNEVVAEIDALVTENNVCDKIFDAIFRMAEVVNDAFPSFAKVRWS